MAVVKGLRSQVQHFGKIANTPAEIKKFGQECDVVAPLLIPRKAGGILAAPRQDL